jgi:glycosyltransferase involved in cell wall biosynthesis
MKSAFKNLGNIGVPVTLRIGVFFYNQVGFVSRNLDQLLEISNAAEKNKISLEVIFSLYDDGSIDGTLEELKRYSESIGLKCHILSDNVNRGVRYRAKEFVSSISSNEIVVFCAGDDQVCTDGLISAIEMMIKEDLHLIIGNARRIDGKSCSLSHHVNWPYSLINSKPREFYEFLIQFYPRPLLVQACIFRSEILTAVEAFSWESKLDDWPLFLRIFSRDFKIKFVDKFVISNYYFAPDSISTNPVRILDLVDEVAVEFKLTNYNGPISQTQFRRFMLYLKHKTFTQKALGKLSVPRIVAGFCMELKYKCKTYKIL